MANIKYAEINFQDDLVSLAKKQLEFLAMIEAESKLHEDSETLNKAIYRYERFWLPFYAYHEENGYDMTKFYPPTDIAWVSSVHFIFIL